MSEKYPLVEGTRETIIGLTKTRKITNPYRFCEKSWHPLGERVYVPDVVMLLVAKTNAERRVASHDRVSQSSNFQT